MTVSCPVSISVMEVREQTTSYLFIYLFIYRKRSAKIVTLARDAFR